MDKRTGKKEKKQKKVKVVESLFPEKSPSGQPKQTTTPQKK